MSGLLARLTWRSAGVGLVVIALLAVALWRGLVWWHLDEESSDRGDAVAVARAEVDGLISITDATSQADIDQLLKRATSGFRSDLDKQSKDLRAQLSKNKVSATGDVVSAGLVSLKDDKASVIVAAAGTVKNKSSKKAQPRNYRLRVELEKVGGTWLVSGLEFVS